MSLAEIEKAIDELPPKELTKLAAYVIRRDKIAWDQEIEEDFSPGGKHQRALAKIDAEIEECRYQVADSTPGASTSRFSAAPLVAKRSDMA